MGKTSIRRLTMAALLCAFTCVATMVIRIPTASGYTNLGDCFVLLSALFLGPVWGFAAGGIGSALADLLAGYAYYIPGTLLIKGLCALIAALLFRALSKKGETMPGLLLSVIPAELFMVFGYWFYETLLLGKPEGALLSIPSNLMQGLFGIVLGVLLYKILTKIPFIKEVLSHD